MLIIRGLSKVRKLVRLILFQAMHTNFIRFIIQNIEKNRGLFVGSVYYLVKHLLTVFSPVIDIYLLYLI